MDNPRSVLVVLEGLAHLLLGASNILKISTTQFIYVSSKYKININKKKSVCVRLSGFTYSYIHFAVLSSETNFDD